MDEKTINSYLDLINIKTINRYYKYLVSGLGIILLTGLLELGIPADIISSNSYLIESSIMLFNASALSLLIIINIERIKKNL